MGDLFLALVVGIVSGIVSGVPLLILAMATRQPDRKPEPRWLPDVHVHVERQLPQPPIVVVLPPARAALEDWQDEF